MPIFEIRKESVVPDRRRFLFRAGYKGSAFSLSAQIREYVGNTHLRALGVIDPFLFYETSDTRELISLGFLPASFFETSRVTVFVSTLGLRMDEEIQRDFADGKTLEPVLLDAWASEALEAINDRFDASIREGRSGTRRFSPGYGDVDIRKNREALAFLSSQAGFALGDRVRVIPSTGILIPRKTTIAMIGWFS